MKSFFKICLPVVVLASACNHRYYAPNTIQVPALSAKNDLILNASAATGPEFSGFEGSVAYSPLKYGAVMVNYFNVASDKKSLGDGSEEKEWGKGQLLEGAVGGYLPLDDRNTLSLFAGFGQGSVYNNYGYGILSDLNFQRVFLQPSIVSQFKYVRVGFGLRFAQLRYTSGTVDAKMDDSEEAIIESLEKDSPIFLPEYALNFGWKLGAVTLNNTMTYSPSQAAQKDNRFAGSNLNMGLTVDLHRIFKL